MSRDGIIDGMTQAIWASSYADYVESLTKSERGSVGAPVNLDGVDWHRDSPEPPEAVEGASRELVAMYESENGASIEDLERRAHAADDEELGRYLAEMAMNTGSSWFDDHARFELQVPLLEAHYDGEFFEWSGLCKTTHQNPAKQSSATGPLKNIFLKRERNGWHVDAQFPKQTLNYGPFKTKDRGMRMREAVIESDLQRNPGALPELGDIVHSKAYGPHEVIRVCNERDLFDGDRIAVFLKDDYGGELRVTPDEIESIERRNPPSKRRLAQSMAYRRPETERPVPGERHTVVGTDQDGRPYTYNTDTGMGHAIHDQHPFLVATRGQAGHAQRGDAETRSDRETRARRESDEYEQYKREAERKRQEAREAQQRYEREAAEQRIRDAQARAREAGERAAREHEERVKRERAEREQRTRRTTKPPLQSPPFDPFDPATAKRDPRRVLGFAPGERLTTDALKRRHRELARKHHPDMGGSLAAMQAINIAVDALMASGQVYGSNPGPAHTWQWRDNPAGLTPKGERMYEKRRR